MRLRFTERADKDYAGLPGIQRENFLHGLFGFAEHLHILFHQPLQNMNIWAAIARQFCYPETSRGNLSILRKLVDEPDDLLPEGV